MKERGIIFSGEMVKALLAGTKTQTRRIIKPQPSDEWMPNVGRYHPTKIDKDGEAYPGKEVFGASDENEGRIFPYGTAGDRLWVRETWWVEQVSPQFSIRSILIGYQADGDTGYRYECDHEKLFIDDWKGAHGNPRASIHMPRWASRLTLEITKVRVERLQEISEKDARAEGIWCDGCSPHKDWSEGRFKYHELWDSLHGAGSWAANPWIWCLSFRVIK